MENDFDIYDIITTQALLLARLRTQYEMGKVDPIDYLLFIEVIMDKPLNELKQSKKAMLNSCPEEYEGQREVIMSQTSPIDELQRVRAYHELQRQK